VSARRRLLQTKRLPREVDQALRTRISEFYQDHGGGKFRQAEALVAAETKDYFYGAKPSPAI
jgi:hypothetical protein